MADNKGKSVLILGAGLVSRPLVDYLGNAGYGVTVASRTLARAEKMIEGIPNTKACQLDVEVGGGEAALEKLVQEGSFNAVISMLPYLLHGLAARVAVKLGVHFLTTSYIQDGVRAVAEEAKKKGLVVINECGVDPGTDHMSAMRVIEKARKDGGKVLSFTSFCGGLPAPEDNDNPFGYKFSWAPRGVLLASGNPAKYLKDGKEVEVKKGTLFLPENYVQVFVDAPGVEDIKFEAYPNRDSTPYVNVFGLKHTKTLLRGTYRYAGWCDTVQKLSELGLLETVEKKFVGGKTFASWIASCAGVAEGTSGDALRTAVGEKLSLDAAHAFVLDRMQWLGLFTEEVISEKDLNSSNLDVLCTLMQGKMQYAPGERDMLLMQHLFVIEYDDRIDTVTSTMVDFGIKNGDSSMSRTVSYPVAIATKLVLEEKFTAPGLSIPNVADLYDPILNEMSSSFNIEWKEKVILYFIFIFLTVLKDAIGVQELST